MSKISQKSDWSKRPLSQKQLQYACDDTHYLELIAGKLQQQLADLNRTHWHQQSCQKIVKDATADKEPRDNDDIWRIKGIGVFSRKILAFIRQLWFWRDNIARELDLPAFRVLTNQLLIELVLWAIDNPQCKLSRGPRLPRHIRGKKSSDLIDTLNQAQQLPNSEWPLKRRGTGAKPQNKHQKLQARQL